MYIIYIYVYLYIYIHTYIYGNTFQLIPGTSMCPTVKEKLLSTATEERYKQAVGPSRSQGNLPCEPQRTPKSPKKLI